MPAPTHGMYTVPEYRAWISMKTRCYRPTYKQFGDYGGRGIRVCDRWKVSFENFFADMGSKPSRAHTLDRIDTDKDYEPTNCRWATRKEQQNNRRNTLLVVYRAQELSLEYAVILAGRIVRRNVARTRIKRGWDVARAVETPQKVYRERRP